MKNKVRPAWIIHGIAHKKLLSVTRAYLKTKGDGKKSPEAERLRGIIMLIVFFWGGDGPSLFRKN